MKSICYSTTLNELREEMMIMNSKTVCKKL